jgi:tetratricopeptide (TPR) repeat protein
VSCRNVLAAQLSKLDYTLTTPSERIANATKEKLKGNDLFKRGEFEAAWKQYDKAFVHIYTSKEEWEAIGPQGRNEINLFKLPCHLNRGLCRLRKDDLDNALWDFSEALRIDGTSAKGHYRRGLVLTRLIQREMAKESAGEHWDMDRAETNAAEAKKDLVFAAKAAPADKSIRDALEELKVVREGLREHRRNYRADQRKLYSSFITNLDKDNTRLQEAEEQGLLADLPPLERVRIA